MPSVRSFLTDLFHKKTEAPPPITTRTAVTLLIVYTLVYVVPFYLSAQTRPSATLSRDAPSVIRARIVLVSLTCLICSVTTWLVLCTEAKATFGDAAHSMGYWPVGLVDAGRSLLLTALLFLGPLFETLIVERGWKSWLAMGPVREVFNEWTTWRNIVAGPVTEEVLFRSASVPLMIIARTPVVQTIFLSPVIFGLAHIHHFYEFRLTHPQTPLLVGVVRSLFQFGFTTLFGAYATFLFLRTGSLLAICLVHAFCNSMGLPRIWGRVHPSGEDQSLNQDKPSKGSLLWTAAYYILLVTGVVLWYRNLWLLTDSPDALVIMKSAAK